MAVRSDAAPLSGREDALLRCLEACGEAARVCRGRGGADAALVSELAVAAGAAASALAAEPPLWSERLRTAARILRESGAALAAAGRGGRVGRCAAACIRAADACLAAAR